MALSLHGGEDQTASIMANTGVAMHTAGRSVDAGRLCAGVASPSAAGTVAAGKQSPCFES